jgi:hypothetical protein
MRAAPHGKQQLIPSSNLFVTLPDKTLYLDCRVHRLGSEVIFLPPTLQVLEASRASETLLSPTERAAQDIHSGVVSYPAVLPLPAAFAWPNEDWAVFLMIGVDADARRISQALTEPEYLEAWITMPDQVSLPGHAESSPVVAAKTAEGYRLDQYSSGRVIASFVGSFLFCHQRKMRLNWRNIACPDLPESLVDFRIRGNFGGSILELRHTAFHSAGDFLWHQQLWSASLPRLASILRSA